MSIPNFLVQKIEITYVQDTHRPPPQIELRLALRPGQLSMEQRSVSLLSHPYFVIEAEDTYTVIKGRISEEVIKAMLTAQEFKQAASKTAEPPDGSPSPVPTPSPSDDWEDESVSLSPSSEPYDDVEEEQPL
jgi:hypothetical protein